MRAETGPIGGELSHEFIVLAETGESAVYCDRAWLETDILSAEVDYERDLEPLFGRWTALYAATDEKHDPALSPVPPESLVTARGIEVGHIFYFGSKYSQAMGAVVALPDGQSVPLEMGSYGIGVSRLVGALIEAGHDEDGIIWPESVAPFALGLIDLRPTDARCRALAEDLYGKLRAAGVEVLYDDREESPGAKFAVMDLIGLPWQLIVGPRGAAAGRIEVKERRTRSRTDLSLDAVLGRFA
jgi:prolyl-tRNA synthetase